MELSGASIVVTGAGGTLGRALVAALVEAGAEPIAVDYSAAGLAELTAEHPDVPAERCDVADEPAVAAAIERWADRRPGFAGLVHAAGTLHSQALYSPFRQPPRHGRATWDDVLAQNLTAAFLAGACTAEALLARRRGGAIVMLSSLAAGGNAGQSAYAAAKAGVDSLAASWGRELGPSGIRAVAVAPGFIDTPATHEALGAQRVAERVRQTPVRRLGAPAEIAQAACFALANDFVNATTLAVDGGCRL